MFICYFAGIKKRHLFRLRINILRKRIFVNTKMQKKFNSFSGALRTIRGEKTQAEMARLLDLNQPTYLRYETGENEPGISIAYNIAQKLGMKLDDLLEGKTESCYVVKEKIASYKTNIPKDRRSAIEFRQHEISIKLGECHSEIRQRQNEITKLEKEFRELNDKMVDILEAEGKVSKFTDEEAAGAIARSNAHAAARNAAMLKNKEGEDGHNV